MYFKLALRSVRQSIKDYLIYIVTLTICVALFYAFLSISSSFYKPDIGQEFNLEALGNWMKITVCLITLLLIFLVQYVNRFMFHRRQKEFAVQSIMGMEQKFTAWLFFIETFIIGLLALVAGIVLGTVCSQFITAMLLRMFQKPFRFSFMLFPDTVLLTIAFFCICFAVTGLFQVQTIQKIKIIDMLRAERENEDSAGTDKWQGRIITVNLIIQFLMGLYGVRTLTYYFAPQFSVTVRSWCMGCIVAPWVMLLASALWRFFGRKKNMSGYLSMAGIIDILDILLVGILPILKMRLSLPMDTGAYNLYILFLAWCIFFLVSVFFFLFHKWLAALKQNSAKLRYHEENLFFFGQILSKLRTNTKTMTMICLTLTGSTALFLLTPVLVGWASGFLDKRTPFDIEMCSGYSKAADILKLPQTDYHLIDGFLEKNKIEIADRCIFRTYFLKEADFYDMSGGEPVTAVSLSDYNHLLAMLGYERISLADNEFATQWISTTNENTVQQFMDEHSTISTDRGELNLSVNQPLKCELGESLYGYQDVICIIPDAVCGGLCNANSFQYIKTEVPLSYSISVELEELFYEMYSTEDGGAYYDIQTSTRQINDTSSAIYVMQTALIYSAIVLVVICFTILALQQLYDARKYKYRFQVLRNMGVEETRIHQLILKQLMLWFGLPVGLSVILAGIFFSYLFFSFSTQIVVYIGVGELLRQVAITFSILIILLISYFSSTLVLFEKSASK